MADDRLKDIKPEILNAHLPQPAPFGVLEWGFVFRTGQVTFVQVETCNFAPGHFLRVPIVLGARTNPAVQLTAEPEFAGVFTIEDADGNTLCTAQLARQIGDVWHATFYEATRQIGEARGTVGRNTPASFIEAALVAVVRHMAAKSA